MKTKEVTMGGYYATEEQGLIFHFYSAGTDGEMRYHAYNQKDGKYRHSTSCTFGTLVGWVDRKATVEEISRRIEMNETSVHAHSHVVFLKGGAVRFGRHLDRRVAHDLIIRNNTEINMIGLSLHVL